MGKKVKITKDGPYIVSDLPLSQDIVVRDKDNYPETWKKGKQYPGKSYTLCRCGKSKNRPFCDGSHVTCKFNGTETASRKNYCEQSKKIIGKEIDLTDAYDLCASASFCDRCGGTWKLTEESDNPENKKIAIQQASDCPSGRLVACKKSGKPIEPKLDQEIGLIEDPDTQISGPIWVKGGVEIESADNFKYEVRNRVTLCRCGQSKNKPFCDGNHITCKFRSESY